MDIKDRIEQYRQSTGMTVQAFEKLCGLSNGTWNKSKEMKEATLIKFIESFPDVNTRWLLTGQGGMNELEDSLTVQEPDSQSEELLQLCRALVNNYKQRDEVMSKLVSMVRSIEG